MDIDDAIREMNHRVLLKLTLQMLLIFMKKCEKYDRLSMMFIKTNISTSIRSSIDQHEKVKDLLKVIDDQFVTSDKALVNTLIMLFSSLTLHGIRDVHDHIMCMKDIVAQLKVLDVTMSDSFLVHYILCTLPVKYAHLKISYNKHKDKWSINELLTMCVQEKERLIMEQGERVYLTAQGKKKEDQAKNKGKIPT